MTHQKVHIIPASDQKKDTQEKNVLINFINVPDDSRNDRKQLKMYGYVKTELYNDQKQYGLSRNDGNRPEAKLISPTGIYEALQDIVYI